MANQSMPILSAIMNYAEVKGREHLITENTCNVLKKQSLIRRLIPWQRFLAQISWRNSYRAS